jgi:hypothetical protein
MIVIVDGTAMDRFRANRCDRPVKEDKEEECQPDNHLEKS